MKKLLYCAAALSAVLFAGSCQRENLEPVVKGGVTYTISLPETVQTKGSNGYAEYHLYYEVYKTLDPTGAQLLFQNNEPIVMTDETYELTLDLLNDQDYTVLFWANKAGAKDENGQPYFNLADLRKVGINAVASNNNDRDAFCGMDQLVNFDAATGKTVTLTRPFAQLNIATLVSTTAGYDVTPLKSFVRVSDIPVTYNVFDGAVSGDKSVEFAKAAVPVDKDVTVNSVDYDLVAMNYILVPEGNVTVYYEIETVNGTVNNTINNVPVKVNYRTNIVGNLLTSNATYTVDLQPGFLGGADETNVEVITDGLVKVLNTGEYNISTANGLAYASQNLFAQEGGSYVLTADIDMTDAVSVATRATETLAYNSAKLVHTMAAGSFEFDGNGHTIKNLPGMFIAYTGSAKSVIVKNLTLETPNVAFNVEDTPDTDGVGAFIGYAGTTTTITLDNCHVKGGKVEGGHWTGGLVGYAAGYSGNDGPVFETLTINDCSVMNATVTGKGSCGGIIGHATGDAWTLVDMDNIILTSNTIKSTGDSNNKAGSVMGTVGAAGTEKTVNGVSKTGGVYVDNCIVSDNTVTSNGVENGKLWGRQGSSTGVLYVDGVEVEDFGVPTEEPTTVTVSNDAGLSAAITSAPENKVRTIILEEGIYSDNINLTVAALGGAKGDLVFKAAEGAAPVIAGTVTLGYRNQGVGAAMWNGNVTFEGITFDHAETAKHSISVGDVKSLTLKNCTIIGDGESGIESARGNDTGTSKIIGCTFVNAAMQILGNFGTNLVIDGCTFNESRINVQAGNGVTVQNCTFNNTLKTANVGDSFYCVRSNSTPITVKATEININSELAEVATSQSKWYLLANHGTTNWTVENVAVTLSDAALMQTELDITACTSTGVINTKNLTVNGKVYASTAAQLTAAVNNGATDIVLAGQFEMPGGSTDKAITFTSLNGTAVIDNTKGSYWEAATLTFNNISFKTGTGMVNGNGADYAALYSKNVTYNSCTFTGPMRLGRDGAKFNACTFNGLGNDYVWTYGNSASFEGCTFNTEGKAILIYSDGPTGTNGAAPAVSVTNCTFNATQGAKAGAIANQNCAAVEIHNYGNGVTLTTSGNTVDEDFSGVWRIKTYETRFSESKIFVNGTEYTTIALDGKTMTIDADRNVTVL